jgi:protein tyrosine/serine phosphatase
MLTPSLPKPQLATPAHVHPGLRNFARISNALCRGAQPTQDGFQALKEMGIRTIVNLRAYHSDRARLKGLGVNYVHLHCRAWWPSSRQTARFLKIAIDADLQPVFVHCLHGSDRTGLAVAAYRIMEQGWSARDAAEELHRFGFHKKYFPQILRYLEKLKVEKLRAKIARAKLPRVKNGATGSSFPNAKK